MRVLVVEDEPEIRTALTRALERQGYAVDSVEDGETADFQGATEDYDAAILDLGLPRLDGLSVLKRWRAADRRFPVICLTARGAWRERVEGIDAGADDYLPKPFEMEELLARLRAVIRRSAGHATPLLRLGPLELDPKAGRITQDGAALSLTALEFRLLAYLLHHAERFIGRSELTEHLYAQDYERDSNTIEVLIARLRRKLGPGVAIRNRRGLGYRLETPQENGDEA